jgi:hypothetical protein
VFLHVASPAKPTDVKRLRVVDVMRFGVWFSAPFAIATLDLSDAAEVLNLAPRNDLQAGLRLGGIPSLPYAPD